MRWRPSSPRFELNPQDGEVRERLLDGYLRRGDCRRRAIRGADGSTS